MKTRQDARATENFTLIRQKNKIQKSQKNFTQIESKIERKVGKSSTRGKVCEKENLKKSFVKKTDMKNN